MNSEFYPGWLTHWGEGFQRVATAPVVATLDDMLRTNASFNFYMFHGGTNFDFTAGLYFSVMACEGDGTLVARSN